MASNTLLLSAKALSYSLEGKCILDQVSLDIHAAEIITLIGPNGAGKSTLIKCLLGILPLHSGTVFKQKNLAIGYVPQLTHLNPAMPIRVSDFLGLLAKVKHTDIVEVLKLVGAQETLNKPLLGISGGEFQRVLLARAILRKPDLLVLDEPTQGIDIAGQEALYGLLAELRNKLACAILVVSHDLHLVMSKTDQVICLNQHVCCSGHPDSVSTDPAYLQLFGITEGESIAVYEHHHDHHHHVSGEVVQSD